MHFHQVLPNDVLADGHKVEHWARHHCVLIFTLAMLTNEDFELVGIVFVLILKHSIVLIIVGIVLDELLKGLQI